MVFSYSPPTPHGHSYYEAAQLAAFALYVGLLLGQGHRRGYAWRSWLPLVAAATLGLVVGCQLIFLPLSNWPGWLRGDAAIVQMLAGGPRSVLGGAAGSLLAVVALRRMLGFRGWAVLDAFAGPLCWALAAQCVGCVLVGCCWGEVATGGLGFSYGPGTLPYLAQQVRGLLPAGAAHTLPLVPTQLYHLLLCAGTGLWLHGLRRRAAAWPGGSRYLLATGLLCLGRLVIEFWRDPAGEPLLAAPLAGLPLLRLQGVLLLESLALLGAWAWLVQRGQRLAPAPVTTPAGVPALVGLGLLLATARLSGSLLTTPETAVLQALLLLVLLAEAQAALPALSRRLPRLAGLPISALLGGALLLTMAQAPAPQRAAPAAGEPTREITLSGGVLGNYHDADEDISSGSGSGCGSSPHYNLYQKVRAAGGELALTNSKISQNMTTHASTLGGGLWVGSQSVGLHMPSVYGAPFVVHPDTTLRFNLVDIHLYHAQQATGHGLTLGYRIGIHLGDLGHYSYGDFGTSAQSNVIRPEAMLNFGSPRFLYAQADAGYGAENALGAYTSRLALGSGLGRVGGSQVLVGYAHSAHHPTPNLAFASATLRLPTGTGLSAVSLEPYFATDFDRHQLFSLKLNYRLGR